MTNQVKDETTLRLYLLGQISTEERLRLEERFFLDPGFYEKLRVVEDELIDEYIYGELSPSDREKFEIVMLSNPAQHQDVRIAKAIKRYAEAHPAPADGRHRSSVVSIVLSFIQRLSAFWRISLATAAVASLAIVGLLAIKLTTPPTQTPTDRDTIASQEPPPDDTNNTNTSADPPRSSDIERQSNQNRGPRRADGERASEPGIARDDTPPPAPKTDGVPASAYPFMLLPGGQVREGGETITVTLPQDADTVHLQLPLVSETDYPSYRATLTGEDKMVRVWIDLKSTASADGKRVNLTVYAGSLSAQQYRIKLDGISKTGQIQESWVYTFRVERK